MDGCPEVSSFAVFDGHNGSMAASTCSQHFNRRVVKRISKLRSAEHSFAMEGFSKQDELDAIVCESIRLTAFEIDSNLKTSHRSGTTVISLFLIHDSVSGNTRVYCASLGDSRCVLYTPSGALEGDLWSTEHDTARTNSSDYSSFCAYQMNEAHTLALRRERQRIEKKSPCRFVALPSEVTKGYMLAIGRDNEEEHGHSMGFVELGYPSLVLLETASHFMESLLKTVDVAPKAVSYAMEENVSMVNALDQTGKIYLSLVPLLITKL